MIILILCVIINGFITTIFKLFGKYNVNTLVAITTNYFVCVLTGMVVYGGSDHLTGIIHQSWLPYSIALGVLLVVVFNIIGQTVQSHGVVISTIFQKMSLIAPATVGILFFQEQATFYKVIGLLLGLSSIYFLSKSDENIDLGKKSLILPFLTLLGSAMVDLALYLIEVCGIAPGADIGFLSAGFLFAGISGFVLMLLKKSKLKIDVRSIVGGIILGIPNFFSIYLLLKVISMGFEGSVVFPINNVGVLIISALIGIFFFKEKLTKYKSIGFALAITAIILISLKF